MKKDEELKYDVVDTEVDENKASEDKNTEEQGSKDKHRKTVIKILIGIGIIIAILLLGFGIKKNKVSAVLSDDLQNEMIDDLAGYINKISADYIDKDDAKNIAKQVIKDNFDDMLVENFMSLTHDEVQTMIDDSLHEYMKDYYTSEKTDEKIDSAVDDITNLFMADLTEIRNKINNLKTEITNLESDYEKYKEITDKTINNMSEKEQSDTERLQTSIEERTKDLQDEINIVNTEIDVKDIETPLVYYVWNTQILKNDSSSGNKDNSDTKSNVWDKWESPEAGMKWHVTGKVYDVSNMTIKEFVEVLAKNDTEFTKSFNKMYEYINDLYKQEKNDRTASDDLIINLFNTRISELQEQIDQINEQLAGLSLWTGSQAEYNALGTKNSNTLYFVTE